MIIQLSREGMTRWDDWGRRFVSEDPATAGGDGRRRVNRESNQELFKDSSLRTPMQGRWR